MKRLKNILLSVDPHTSTYTKMYEGPISIVDQSGANYPDFDSTYYCDYGIGYVIERTNKLALDKPTITIQIPVDVFFEFNYQTIAAADFCLRTIGPYFDALNSELENKSRPDNENGKYYVHKPGGEVILKNTAYFSECVQKNYDYSGGITVIEKKTENSVKSIKTCLCIKIQVQLPKGKIRKTIQMLCKDLPSAIAHFVDAFDYVSYKEAIELEQQQQRIRMWLAQSDFCSFIANGSILPRSKSTFGPLNNAIPFVSPKETEISIYGLTGMGIKRGVTIITGGGYSGKSTLIEAISSGIYNHVKGDGRELCITDDSAVIISAEDGRSIKGVNISPFIRWIPDNSPQFFTTECASGSTSQAANIVEAIDGGSTLLLIDEDKSATNFMIRDSTMKKLIENDPIVPFTERVRELHTQKSVSTILVIGGCSEYLGKADKVFMMKDYILRDVTLEAKSMCSIQSNNDELDFADWDNSKTLCAKNFSSYPQNCNTEKLETLGQMGFVVIGDELIDIRPLYNVVSVGQKNALGFMLRYLETTNTKQLIDIHQELDMLYTRIEAEGLDCVFSPFFTKCERFLELPRKIDLLSLINRMRRISFQSIRNGDQ